MYSFIISALGIGLFGTAAIIGLAKQPVQNHLFSKNQVHTLSLLTENQFEVSPTVEGPYISETSIRPGDTLLSVLQRLSVDFPSLQNFLVHNSRARSIYKLYPGRIIQAAKTEAGNLLWLRYIHTSGSEIDGHVTTQYLQVTLEKGTYKAEEVIQNTECYVRAAVGTIRSSLFSATDIAGVPDSVTLQMTDILASKIDFIRDLRHGDQFRILYEVRTYEGRYMGAGRLLALEFVNQGKVYNAVWFSLTKNNGSYYSFDGASLRGDFLRTALKFSRISSTFGMRMHPIHKTWIGHRGVDYAAPSGTPIHATADGLVEFSGWQNGYGNVVILKHCKNYSTLYAHQSRIASSVVKGARVTQGQLVGYVGATGWATGPHLHYELRINNQPVDPLSIKLPIARAISPGEAQAFSEVVSSYERQIGLLRNFQRLLPESLTYLASR